MRWSSWAEFWAMGGYALYVWGSMGVTAVLMGLEVWLARREQTRTLRWLRSESVLHAEHDTLKEPR